MLTCGNMPREPTPGFLLLRPDQDGIGPVIELLEMVLASYDLEMLTETVAVGTPRGIRVRRTGT